MCSSVCYTAITNRDFLGIAVETSWVLQQKQRVAVATKPRSKGNAARSAICKLVSVTMSSPTAHGITKLC